MPLQSWLFAGFNFLIHLYSHRLRPRTPGMTVPVTATSTESLPRAKHCPKNFNSITWRNSHDSRMMSTCFFPVYSYRCTLWGLKRLNNLPKITELVCGAGRDMPQAPTSRLSLGRPCDLLQTTSHSVSLCQWVDHARGVQAHFTYKALHLLPPVQRSL